MSIATDLQTIYTDLNAGLDRCVNALIEKGANAPEARRTIFGVGESIKTIKDGKYLNPLITRTITTYVATDDLWNVGEYAFANCKQLTTADFSVPIGVAFSSYAFYNCTSLTEVIFNLSGGIISTACNYLFAGCSSLREITYPANYGLGTGTFKDCTQLQKVNFVEGLTSAGSGTFENCTNINNIILPSSCTGPITGILFKNCSSLDTLVIKSNSVCTLASKLAFAGTPIESGVGYIYVPSALITQYQSATNWSVFANQFRAIEDYPDIVGG